MNKTPKLIEGIDYIINQDGNLVFTETYLLKRGHCCQSGCMNCPYGYHEKVDPSVPSELHDAWSDDEEATSDYFLSVDPDDIEDED